MTPPAFLQSPVDARLLGDQRLRGAMPWVIAIMSFSILIIAAAGLALANTAAKVTRSAEARYSIQLPGGGEASDRIAARVGAIPGVTGVDAVPEARMRETLEQWLGPAAKSRDLPVPAVIHFNLADEARLSAVAAQVRAIDPRASVSAHRQSLGPLLSSLHTLQWVALGLVVLLATATAAAVVLAARGALDTHRTTIDIMHGIGATDTQVTQIFQRKIALDALAGSVGGGLAAGLVLSILAAGSAFLGDLTGGATLGWTSILILMLLPLLLTVLATGVARSTVLAALRKSL